MKREEVEKVALDTDKQTVIGLPAHLKAKISHSGFGYQYHLTRKGDTVPYKQNQPSGSAEIALEALKKLLNWDAV